MSLLINTIKFENTEYNVDELSDAAKASLASLEFATSRIQELNNLQALLQRAKNSYVKSLKTEILSQKSGFLLHDE